MRSRSSSSLKIFFAEKTPVLRQIEAWAVRLKERDPNREKAGLFGSYAKGDVLPHSFLSLRRELKKVGSA
jgi:hypothetical protein